MIDAHGYVMIPPNSSCNMSEVWLVYLHIGVRSSLLVLLVIRAMPHAMRQRDEQQIWLSRFFYSSDIMPFGSVGEMIPKWKK